MIDLPGSQNGDILKGYSMLLYFAGSFILNEPSDSCIRDLASQDIFRKMPVSSKNPGFMMACSFLNSINSDSAPEFDEILADHLRLFGGGGETLAPPYESVYRSPDHLMNQESAMEVRHIYRTYGWQSSLRGIVPDDHLGIELQFLNLLLEKYSEIEDGVCHKEISSDIKKFIGNHLKPWINDWNRDVQSHAVSSFYKGIGYLVASSVQDIYHLV